MKEKIKQTFLDLIAIDGIYPYEQKVIEYIQKRFDAAGISWQQDAFGNIIAKIPGRGEPVLLSTHVDIPEPTPQVRYNISGDLITADGTCILGADPKTGLAILIEFLISLASLPADSHLPVEAALTRGEETGLLGAINLDYSLLSAKAGLVLDEDGPVTQAVIQAPAFVKVDAEILGKVVHPREPEKGINALQAACDALMALPWGYIADGVTWNVGLFEAGTARNSVPGSAKLRGELRSYNTAAVVAAGEKVRETLEQTAQKYGARLQIRAELEFEGYKLEKSNPLFAKLEQTYAAMDLKPNYFPTFGGSDANIFNAHGITAIPIGSGYFNAHQYTEAADLAAMQQIFEFLEKFCGAAK